MRRVGFCVFLLFLPNLASAAVSISEVAWMGSASSANHEWIELQNEGTAVDVTGWKLSDGMNLEIELEGTIPADKYVVLERTSDESVSGTAFLVYAGALVNTGATLRLERVDGTLVDQVSGGEDWQNIGGDNATKETAQYTSGGWVTAAATPGRGITATEVDVAAASTQPESTTKSSTGIKATRSDSGETVRLVVPDVTLELAVAAQEVGYVNQPISFSVTPSGIGKDLLNSLVYEWNFGDGEVSSSKEPIHVFKYPGTYVVTVYAGFKRQEQVARHEITILPAEVSLTTNQAGDVQLNNDSPYEIDLSDYRVRGDKIFTFPPRTILLPNQTITIPRYKLGKTGSRLVGVYDTEAVLIASIVPDNLQQQSSYEPVMVIAPEPQISAWSLSSGDSTPTKEFGFATSQTEENVILEDVLPTPSSTYQLASVGAALPATGSRWPYFALIGTLLVGTLGIYAAPRRNENT